MQNDQLASMPQLLERREIRFDPAPSGKPSARADSSLLGLFRMRGAPAARERRSEMRHEVVECRAWLGWRIWRGFRAPDALIINISRGGAMVFLDEPPPERRPVWIFLETPELKAIIKAKTLEVRTTNSGQCAVRLAFDTPCPYSVFDAAVCGLPPADPKRRIHAEGRVTSARA
jgi:hypothetical protein